MLNRVMEVIIYCCLKVIQHGSTDLVGNRALQPDLRRCEWKGHEERMRKGKNRR